VDGGAELRVTDAGQGIPPALRDGIFSAFVRAPPPAGAQEPLGLGAKACNHGLGLTFCKFAVEVHGGNIWVEDAQPGAAFCVRLPDGP
jgi:signal transduction histidine kinase